MSDNPVQLFINKRGGRAVIADRLNMRPETVGMWITRKRIPRTVWPEIVEKFHASLDELKATETM